MLFRSKAPIIEDSSSGEDEQVQTKVVEKVAEKPAAKTSKKPAPKKQSEESKVQEKVVSKAPEKKGKWEELSNESEHDEQQFDNDEQEVQEAGNKYESKRGVKARYEKSATNFDYSQYAGLNEPIGNLNSRDLMKVLIVRSYNEGQHQLCKTLKQTLRAMNLECDFPFANTNRREQHSLAGNNGAPRTGFAKGQSNATGGFERRNGPVSTRPYSREERQSRPQFRKNDYAIYDM